MLQNSLSTSTAAGISSGTSSSASSNEPGSGTEIPILQLVVASAGIATIKLDTVNQSYPITINWGDGTTAATASGNASHTYAASGSYDISMNSASAPLCLATTAVVGDKQEFIGKIYNWNLLSLGLGAFNYSANLDTTEASGAPVLVAGTANIGKALFDHAATSGVLDIRVPIPGITDLDSAFKSCGPLVAILNSWDVSSVTSCYRAFYNLVAGSSVNINAWDTSSVTNMQQMFWSTEGSSFGSLSEWNVSSVINMSEMFEGALLFNGNISRWDVSSVTTFNRMFTDASAFNQDIGGWDVSSATSLRRMFGNAASLTQSVFNQDLSAWDLSSVTTVEGMFNSESTATYPHMSAANLEKTLYGWSLNAATPSTVDMADIVGSDAANIAEYTYATGSNMDLALNDATYGLVAAKGWTGVSNITIA
mgnify:CR=1 FL=1|tara:strand:- start:2025 stop:3293 length:1269 start_codon:yes stop_codon:yes gene_type:complete